jgi:hypothetical protein
LTSGEIRFLHQSDDDSEVFQVRVETLCAFAWSLGFIDTLNFDVPAPNHLVTLFLDFRLLDSADRFKRGAQIRSNEEFLSACDAAYCPHWAINQAALDGKKPPKRLPRLVVVERRRALAWIIGKDDWEDIALDT